MKKVNLILFALIATYNLNVLAQSESDFDSQLSTYYKFIDNPIHFPKWSKDLIIDKDAHEKYLNFEFKKGNFYLNETDIAWGGNWFAWANGGIANRWRINEYPKKDQLNKEYWKEVEKMTVSEIANLSPIEKYDIYTCGKGFEFFWASNQELIARGPYKLPSLDQNGNEIPCGYCGFCNGARVSGALMPEPIKEIKVKSRNHPEIEIIFYPADLKALAAASFYYLDQKNTLNLGLNYNNNLSTEKNRLNTPNPAVLDIILRQYLNAHKIPLFIDVQYNNEIWNETILGYNRDFKEIKNIPNGTYMDDRIKKSVLIECTLYCQDEVSIVDINKKTTTIMANKTLAIQKGWVKERKYRYELLLDNNNTIINGKWIGSYLQDWNTGEMKWTNKPIDFIWLGKGIGADETHTFNPSDSQTSNYTGNSNLKFEDILELFKLSSE